MHPRTPSLALATLPQCDNLSSSPSIASRQKALAYLSICRLSGNAPRGSLAASTGVSQDSTSQITSRALFIFGLGFVARRLVELLGSQPDSQWRLYGTCQGQDSLQQWIRQGQLQPFIFNEFQALRSVCLAELLACAGHNSSAAGLSPSEPLDTRAMRMLTSCLVWALEQHKRVW